MTREPVGTGTAERPVTGFPADVPALARLPLPLLLGPLVAIAAVGLVADVAWAGLVADHPLVLVAMSARTRNLVLASPSVDVVPFLLVAVVRALLGDPFAYLLGRRYGDRTAEAVIRRAGRRRRLATRLVALTRRAGPVAVLVAPGAVVCALVGAAGMNGVLFVACNVVGTVVRVALIRLAGEAFADPLTALVRWVGDHRWAVTGVMLTIVVTQWVRRRRAPEEEASVVAAIEELEEESAP